MREYPVRICEGLGVKFPGPTRHFDEAGDRVRADGADIARDKFALVRRLLALLPEKA